MKPGSYLIDHTSSAPGLAQEIEEKAKELGVHSIDAPVSGGDLGARNGNLVVFIGGEEKAIQDSMPLLDIYS